MSIKLKTFLVTYDRLLEKVVENLDEEEKKLVNCYAIQKSVTKDITNGINVINEWELLWNDYSYQQKQYYEYGSFIHLLNNKELLKDITHIGILHYDIIFEKNSLNNVIKSLEKNPNKIFYNRIRFSDELYLSLSDLYNICDFINKRLNMSIKYEHIIKNGWISECLSIVPIGVFNRFANFLQDYRIDIENILINNMWGIMNTIDHRICGIVERMWGIYLVSCGLEKEQCGIIHDWDFYKHKHQEEKNWIKR